MPGITSLALFSQIPPSRSGKEEAGISTSGATGRHSESASPATPCLTKLSQSGSLLGKMASYPCDLRRNEIRILKWFLPSRWLCPPQRCATRSHVPPLHCLELGFYTYLKNLGCSGFARILKASDQIIYSDGCCVQTPASNWIKMCPALVRGLSAVSLLSLRW